MILQKLLKGSYPKYFTDSLIFEVVTGSQSYGAAFLRSDTDAVGVVLPPVELMFPGSHQTIFGFDDTPLYSLNFSDDNHDYKLFNIAVYFKHLMDGDFDLAQTLFTCDNDVVIDHPIYRLICDNYKLFITKKTIYNCRRKIENIPDLYNKDIDGKNLYHYARLVYFLDDLLNFGRIDLKKYSVILSDIRRHYYSSFRVFEMVDPILKHFDKSVVCSSLPDTAPTGKIRDLLMQCIEDFYGFCPFDRT